MNFEDFDLSPIDLKPAQEFFGSKYHKEAKSQAATADVKTMIDAILENTKTKYEIIRDDEAAKHIIDDPGAGNTAKWMKRAGIPVLIVKNAAGELLTMYIMYKNKKGRTEWDVLNLGSPDKIRKQYTQMLTQKLKGDAKEAKKAAKTAAKAGNTEEAIEAVIEYCSIALGLDEDDDISEG